MQAEAETADLQNRLAGSEAAATAAMAKLERREAALAEARGQITLLSREKTESENWLFTDL